MGITGKHLAGVYILWITLFIFSSAMDGFLMIAGRDSLINDLIGSQFANIQGAGIVQIPMIAVGFVQAILSIVTWDFAFLNNDIGIILKTVLLYPISLTVVISLILFLSQVTSSTVATISVVGGIIGAGAAAFASLLS